MKLISILSHWFVAVSVAGIVPVASAATEDPAWYLTIAGGVKASARDTDSTVNLGQAPVQITLEGSMRYNGGQVAALALGKQFHSYPTNADQEPWHWRIEAELWQGRFQRSTFDVGVLHVNLDDFVRASVLFLNGLLRIGATEKTRWWLGAGVGYGKVRLPDASSVASCTCLSVASGDGAAGHVKLVSELLFSERTAGFLELGYVSLPTTSTIGALNSRTSHEGLRSSTIALGLRIRF